MQVLLASSSCKHVCLINLRGLVRPLYIYIHYSRVPIYISMIYIDDCNIGWQIAGIMYAHAYTQMEYKLETK